MNAPYLITRTFHSITAERYRTGANRDAEPYNVSVEAVPATTSRRRRRARRYPRGPEAPSSGRVPRPAKESPR